MKIILLNDTDNWAGTESHILDLAAALRAQSAEVAIACPPSSPLAQRVSANVGAGANAGADAIPIVPFRVSKLVDTRAIRRLTRLLKSGRADVLHAHNGRTQLHGALAVVMARRGKLVWTQHFIAPHHAKTGGLKGGVMKRVHRAINARTHGFIAISQAVKTAMIERGEALDAQISVVPNGIGDPRIGDPRIGDPRGANLEDVRARYGVAPGAPLAVALCRLESEKQVAVLLRAWAELAAPDARLLIGGRGAQQKELQAQIAELQLENSVQLVGFVENALSLLNCADLFVHPAPAEPFGLVFLEAMALGKPVVACSGGAAPEIVNARSGITVGPGDFKAMARALGDLLSDKERAQQLGRAGRARFEAHFTRERMARDTLAVYQKVFQKVSAR